MSLRQIAFLCLLTLLYLTAELAFNARLLDVVGGVASAEAVHHIEIFGRSLSGIAAALVVLQWLMTRRQRKGTGSPTTPGIFFWCALAAALVYGGLYALVELLTINSTPNFRRLSLNVALIQRALVDGNVEIDGLDDDRTLFAQPQGKAFLALFPALALSVDQLDVKIRDAKLQLITRALDRKIGGAKAFYGSYTKAIVETQAQWNRYRGVPQDVEGRVQRESDKAWRDYLADLGKRGWTPSTVPPSAQGAVLRKVSGRVPVPAGWALNDEAGFREAVATRVRQRMGAAAGRDGSVVVRGKRVPPGLGFDEFLRQPGVQAELRDRLGVPANTVIAPAYASSDAFDRQLYRPMLEQNAQKALKDYDAPAADFADTGRLQAQGLDAARAVVVPPIALFFSLLGAIGHLSKLAYLLVKAGHRIVARRRPDSALARLTRHPWWVPVVGVLGAWAVLSLLDNSVTQSRLYGYMAAQALARNGDSGSNLGTRLILNAAHVVAVGQGYAYPVDEKIRMNLLGGFDFGYQEAAR